MKSAEILLIALAGVAVLVVLTKAGGKEASGWTQNADGSRTDPLGNRWKGGQLIEQAPGSIWVSANPQALSAPIWI